MGYRLTYSSGELDLNLREQGIDSYFQNSSTDSTAAKAKLPVVGTNIYGYNNAGTSSSPYTGQPHAVRTSNGESRAFTNECYVLASPAYQVKGTPLTFAGLGDYENARDYGKGIGCPVAAVAINTFVATRGEVSHRVLQIYGESLVDDSYWTGAANMTLYWRLIRTRATEAKYQYLISSLTAPAGAIQNYDV